MAEVEGHQSWKPQVLGDTSTWMMKVPMMISRIGMKRGRGLDVKEQREVNEWKQYCDYMESSHWNSDCGREG